MLQVNFVVNCCTIHKMVLFLGDFNEHSSLKLLMKNRLLSVWHFYREGFHSMTWGRTLWILILVKLFIIFFVLKLFFFPDFLRHHGDGETDSYVSRELIQRVPPPVPSE